MKKIAILISSLFVFTSVFSEQYSIYSDSPTADRYGYGNFHIESNGELDLIANFIKDNDIVFDVGAAVGEWSCHVFSRSSPQMYVFEPIPESFKKLKNNLASKNARVFNLGLSNRKGEKTIAWYNNAQGWAELSSFYRREEVEKSSKVVPVLLTVQTYDLDTFCQEQKIESINFLKIDTEGSELDILRGAQKMLSTKKISVIQFEYGGTYIDAKTTLKEVYNLLTASGYMLYRIIPNGLIRIKAWRPELETFQYSNYLALSNPL